MNGRRKLRVLTFGAGAIGTYIGGSLALQGHQVIFLEREEKFPALREKGFFLEHNQGRDHLPRPELAPDLKTALSGTAFDLAIFALKSYHNPRVITDLERYRDSFPPLLCLQNGISNEKQLAGALGEEKIIPGTVTTAVQGVGTGDIVVEKKRGTGIGGDHPLCQGLVEVFNQAGLNASHYPDAEAMKWSKCLINLMGNASSAILDIPPGEIYRDAETFSLEIRQLREALAVMKSASIPPVDLPGVPVKLLAVLIQYPPLWLSRPILARAVSGGRGDKMPSFHQDLIKGKKYSEVEKLNGAVVQKGKSCGVPTPVNKVLTETLLALAAGEKSRDDYAGNPRALLTELE